MSSSRKESSSLSKEDKFLLEEYQVCNNKAHSYTRALWQTGAIFIAGSILLLNEGIRLYVANQFKLVLPLAIISIATLVLWIILYNRFRWYNQLAFIRARAIEEHFANYNRQSLTLKIEHIDTEPINSWIHHMEKTSAPLKLRKSILAFTLLFVIIWVIIISLCLIHLS